MLVIDLDKLEANIVKLQPYLSSHGIANRPHIKAHKIPEIAHMQIRAGAIGITCQKLGEAEVMADAGIRGSTPARTAAACNRRRRPPRWRNASPACPA